MKTKGSGYMEHTARKMLDFIKTDDCCKAGHCLLSVFYDRYCKYAGCTRQEAMACIRYLKETEYIRFVKDQHGRNIGFELEHKARHSLYFTLKEHWLLLRNSIVIPAVVAFITAAITADAWPFVKELLYSLWQAIQAKRQ